eukprot:5152950-Alexandrium_andersonii.AAC.1
MPRRVWRSSLASVHRHWGCPGVCRTSVRPHLGSPVVSGVRLERQCISTRRCPNAQVAFDSARTLHLLSCSRPPSAEAVGYWRHHRRACASAAAF